jgi:hypothetical protein
MNTDYKKPIIYQQSDYRTSQSRGHRFLLSSERNFIPIRSSAHPQNPRNDYRPKSETAKEFQWKINQYRNFREELAPALDRVRYLHQFTDKIKASEIIKPLHPYEKFDKPTFCELPREVKLTPSIVSPPFNSSHIWKQTQFTNTPGYYPLNDGLVSTTEINFHQHKNYSDAQTKLIKRVELPFNADVAHFIPKSKIIVKYPMCRASAENIRDKAKFKTPTFDRITITKVPFRGLQSEKMEHF